MHEQVARTHAVTLYGPKCETGQPLWSTLTVGKVLCNHRRSAAVERTAKPEMLEKRMGLQLSLMQGLSPSKA